MNKQSIISILFLFATSVLSLSFGQNQTSHHDFIFQSSISQKADYITSDKLGNLYVIDNNQLIKFNSQLELEKTYSNLNLGAISFIDAADPLKIILYYKDFSTVEFLDNTLSPSGDPVSLRNLGLELATLVCSSFDNSFWVYEPQNFQLIRLDKKLQILFNSGNINQITGNDIQPVFMIEYNNHLYLSDPETGILVFDRYGTYYKTIPIKSLNNFQIIDTQLYYFSESSLKVYNLKTHDEISFPLPENDVHSISLFRGVKQMKIFIQFKDKISVYLLK
ncbi:hypothetical protein ACFLRZ_01735 [Bacteroidota bacterium]